MRAKKAGADKLKKYGWFNQYYTLCQGDALKMKEVKEMNVMEALNFLSYEKDRAEVLNNMSAK